MLTTGWSPEGWLACLLGTPTSIHGTPSALATPIPLPRSFTAREIAGTFPSVNKAMLGFPSGSTWSAIRGRPCESKRLSITMPLSPVGDVSMTHRSRLLSSTSTNALAVTTSADSLFVGISVFGINVDLGRITVVCCGSRKSYDHLNQPAAERPQRHDPSPSICPDRVSESTSESVRGRFLASQTADYAVEHPPSPKLPSHKSKSHLPVGAEVFEQAAGWHFLAPLNAGPNRWRSSFRSALRPPAQSRWSCQSIVAVVSRPPYQPSDRRHALEIHRAASTPPSPRFLK